MAFVDVELIDGLALPYQAGAEAALADPALDPALDAAWQAVTAIFPGLTLLPLFDQQPVDELADIVDAIRFGGAEPPDPFRWFAIDCDPSDAEAIAAFAADLPFVAAATVRSRPLLPGTVSYGTNPDTLRTIQIQPAPAGVDAIYAWQVAGGSGIGVQLADVESGWNTNHEELLTSLIYSPAGFRPDLVPDGGHGTCVAGILVGADNGVGTIGIVPNAELTLIADDGVLVDADDPHPEVAGAAHTAAVIAAAIATVGVGGVVLIEEALNFFARPPRPDGTPDGRPDILVEFQPAIQTAIRLAALFGITVIEPAGNGGVDLDKFPFLAHTRPGAPTFSFATVVGAADLADDGTWKRTSSSFGSRVDCFGPGSLVRAPSNAAPDAYLLFNGTSSASAVVAGVAAAVQGMALANDGVPLGAIDMRRLLSDPALGTPVGPTAKGGIGTMPDLRRIARARKWTRVLPVGAAAVADGALVIAHLDEDDHLVVRFWTALTGWGIPLPLRPANAQFSLTACTPAITATEEEGPLPRLVTDLYLMGPAGIHPFFVDSAGQEGDLTAPLAPVSVGPVEAAAQGRSLAAVRTRVDLLVLAAVSPAGQLVVMTGNPDAPAGGITDPLVVSGAGSYRRGWGPVLVSRGPELADLVAIEDGGSLTWLQGNTAATIGTGWGPAGTDPTFTAFDPGARPALLDTGTGLLVAAVGADGHLRAVPLDPDAATMGAPVVVDAAVRLATSGPVALGSSAGVVVALGVDTSGVLRVATRPEAGAGWTDLAPVPAPQPLSVLGGVTAVSMPGTGVLAVAVGRDGTILSSLSVDGLSWPALVPATPFEF